MLRCLIRAVRCADCRACTASPAHQCLSGHVRQPQQLCGGPGPSHLIAPLHHILTHYSVAASSPTSPTPSLLALINARRSACSTSPSSVAVCCVVCHVSLSLTKLSHLHWSQRLCLQSVLRRLTFARPPHHLMLNSSSDLPLLRKLHQQHQLCRWQMPLSRRFELDTL